MSISALGSLYIYLAYMKICARVSGLPRCGNHRANLSPCQRLQDAIVSIIPVPMLARWKYFSYLIAATLVKCYGCRSSIVPTLSHIQQFPLFDTVVATLAKYDRFHYSRGTTLAECDSFHSSMATILATCESCHYSMMSTIAKCDMSSLSTVPRFAQSDKLVSALGYWQRCCVW